MVGQRLQPLQAHEQGERAVRWIVHQFGPPHTADHPMLGPHSGLGTAGTEQAAAITATVTHFNATSDTGFWYPSCFTAPTLTGVPCLQPAQLY